MELELSGEFPLFINNMNKSVREAGKYELDLFIEKLINEKRNTEENIVALLKILKDTGNRNTSLYLLQILERERVEENLTRHIARVLGKDRGKSIFRDLRLPPRGAPPETALTYTNELVIRLQQLACDEDSLSLAHIKSALTANAHGIPATAFENEKRYFLESLSLDDYLQGSHKRAVENLQKHADSGEVWFEQIITQDVVDYVKNNREILGGVFKEGKIYLTKIPYKPDEWLRETDPQKRRYLACHCPMAREALNGAGTVPPLWCHCSAGFARQKFMALFEEDLETEVVDSVLSGGQVCRFALTVPQRYVEPK